MATEPSTAALIYPIGHYVGASYRSGSPERTHHVMVGAETVRLSDEQLAAWLMTRGMPDDGNRPWTREAVEEMAARAGVDNVPRSLEELGDMGLVRETTPGTDHAIDFAEAHRVVPLMLGLGNTPEEPWRHGIGLFDQPLLTVSHEVYGLWEWAHVDPNLWAACFSHADVAKRAGATDPEETDPEQIVAGFLHALHPLLTAGAAYLDVALPEPEDDDVVWGPMVARPGDIADALVFPVGHYVGAYYPEVDAPLKYRKLRVGVEIEQLTEEAEFGVWALAHGFPDRAAEVAWTRHAVLDAAGSAGIPDPAAALDRLVARGLIALVHPDRPEAVEFAARHRVQSLLAGLGNTPDDLSTFGIGLIGLEPAVTVDAFGYQIWQRGRLAPNLWVASEMFAKAGDRADAPETLGRMLRLLHRLLAGNAAYLDAVL